MTPSVDELLDLHQRFRAGDRAALEEIARRVLKPLYTQLQGNFPAVDEQVVWDGLSDAMLEYYDTSEHLEVATGAGLLRVLRARAWRNIANALRGERRRRAREERFGDELSAGSVEDSSALGTLIQGEEAAERQQQIQRIMAVLPDPVDREVLRLRLAGERKTEVFARALGIDRLAIAEQRKQVKRIKDRIDKVIRREVGR